VQRNQYCDARQRECPLYVSRKYIQRRELLICKLETMTLHLCPDRFQHIHTTVPTEKDTDSNLSASIATSLLFVLLFPEPCTPSDDKIFMSFCSIVICWRCLEITNPPINIVMGCKAKEMKSKIPSIHNDYQIRAPRPSVLGV
jgi:hypothetical protein